MKKILTLCAICALASSPVQATLEEEIDVPELGAPDMKPPQPGDKGMKNKPMSAEMKQKMEEMRKKVEAAKEALNKKMEEINAAAAKVGNDDTGKTVKLIAEYLKMKHDMWQKVGDKGRDMMNRRLGKGPEKKVK